MIAHTTQYNNILKTIPNSVNDSTVLTLLHNKCVNWKHVQALKETSLFNDETISHWLNINVKTFRSYKKPNGDININIKEHVVLLLSLMKHGKSTFKTTENFKEWLEKTNFFFDHKAPIYFLQTITGIRFIDDRLTAMEYGDNI